MTPVTLTLDPILERLNATPPRMAPIDRRAWVGSLSFVVQGVQIGIRVNEPVVLQQLADYLPPGFRMLQSPRVDHLYSVWIGDGQAAPGDAASHRLYAGRHELARTPILRDLLEHLESHLHHQGKIIKTYCPNNTLAR
jgi:hypothetical protein